MLVRVIARISCTAVAAGLDIDDLSAQLLSVNQKLKDEVKRLMAENFDLSREKSVEPVAVESSDNAGVLVNQVHIHACTDV